MKIFLYGKWRAEAECVVIRALITQAVGLWWLQWLWYLHKISSGII